jgi:hypothetical protein
MGRDLSNLPQQGKEYDLLIEFTDKESKIIKVYDSDLLNAKLEKTYLDILRNSSILQKLLKKSKMRDQYSDWKLMPFLKIRKDLLEILSKK